MLNGVVAAGLEDVVEANEVALDVGIGVGDAIADARLGSEVYHDVELVLIEEFVNQRFVSNVALHEVIFNV